MPAGRMALRLPSDAWRPSGISLRAPCSGNPKTLQGLLLAKQILLSAQNALVISERSCAECWHSPGWARCQHCDIEKSWVQKPGVGGGSKGPGV